MTEYADLVINAFCTGIGASLGSFLTNRLLIKRVTDIEEKMVKKSEEKENNETHQ